MALQYLNVVCPLKGCRVCDVALAQAPANVFEGVKVAGGEPVFEPFKQHFDIAHSVFEQCRCGHDNICSDQQILYNLILSFDSGIGSE